MGAKLLIVDDETEITDALKEYFQIKGFTVFTAATAEEAFALLSREKPDIVTLDMMLKGRLDGIDVLKQARNLSPLSKIIMLTGSDTALKEKEARNLTVERYIKKPITPRELNGVINEVLKEN